MSIVAPYIPSGFEAVKMDYEEAGQDEIEKAKTRAKKHPIKLRPDRIKTKYNDIHEKHGDKAFADPVHKAYPIDTYEHTRAAISYFSQPDNYKRYTPEERKYIWKRIMRAAKKFGIKVSDPDKHEEEIAKGRLKKDVMEECDMREVSRKLEEDGFKPVSKDEWERAKEHVKRTHPHLFKSNDKDTIMKRHAKIVQRIHQLRNSQKTSALMESGWVATHDYWTTDPNAQELLRHMPKTAIPEIGEFLRSDSWNVLEELFNNSPYALNPFYNYQMAKFVQGSEKYQDEE